MGYFANGFTADTYEEMYCEHCVHYSNCAVIEAHLLHGYDECNNPDSILHMFIPEDKNGNNKKCRMFWPVKEVTE